MMIIRNVTGRPLPILNVHFYILLASSVRSVHGPLCYVHGNTRIINYCLLPRYYNDTLYHS